MRKRSESVQKSPSEHPARGEARERLEDAAGSVFPDKAEDQILQGLATGKFDGKNPCRRAPRARDLHDPYSRRDEQDTPKVRYLNINKNITAVASGRLDPNIGRDILLVGTNTDVMAPTSRRTATSSSRRCPTG